MARHRLCIPGAMSSILIGRENFLGWSGKHSHCCSSPATCKGVMLNQNGLVKSQLITVENDHIDVTLEIWNVSTET